MPQQLQKKVIETRVIEGVSINALNKKLVFLQTDSHSMNAPFWEPHGEIVIKDSSYILVMNCYALVAIY